MYTFIYIYIQIYFVLMFEQIMCETLYNKQVKKKEERKRYIYNINYKCINLYTIWIKYLHI